MKVLLKQKLFLVNVTLFLLLTSCETSPGSEVARSPRDLKVDVRHDFYDVEGSTVKELLDAMLERGPKEDGKSFFGYAKWYVNWRFWYASKGNDCEMTKVMVSLDVSITLPRWRPPAEVSEKLVEKWNAFVGALEHHENGHKKNGIRAAKEILQELKSLRTRSCSNIEEKANAKAHQIIRKYNRRDTAFDQETNHGRKQGARWPPKK